MRTPLIMKLADNAHKWGKPENILRSEAFSVYDLCTWAGIECRAFGHHADFKMIGMIGGNEHFLLMEDDGPFYSIGRDFIEEVEPRDVALRALEIMAYTFKEYTARECLNGQGLFIAPPWSYSRRNEPTSESLQYK